MACQKIRLHLAFGWEILIQFSRRSAFWIEHAWWLRTMSKHGRKHLYYIPLSVSWACQYKIHMSEINDKISWWHQPANATSSRSTGATCFTRLTTLEDNTLLRSCISRKYYPSFVWEALCRWTCMAENHGGMEQKGNPANLGIMCVSDMVEMLCVFPATHGIPWNWRVTQLQVLSVPYMIWVRRMRRWR